MVAGGTNVSCRAGTDVISTHWAGVTVGAFLTGIADAGIIQLAQQSWQIIKKIKILSNAGWNFVQLLLTGIFTCQIACTHACLQMLKATIASIEKVSLNKSRFYLLAVQQADLMICSLSQPSPLTNTWRCVVTERH